MPKPTEASADPGLDALLCFGLYSASHAFSRFYKKLLDGVGLTYPQYLAMIVLGETDDQTVGQIGARLSLESSTLTPLLKRLEQAGYIRRTRSRQDERQVRVGLTDSGRAVLQRARALPGCVAQAVGRTPEQLSALKAEVDQLRRRLDAQTADPDRALLPV